MVARCKGTSSKKANHNYHDRGIRVCKAWKKFENFATWAMANGYRDDLTLERRENDGNYSPDNCCWVSRKTQNNNSRNNRLLTLRGQTKTQRQWAALYGISEAAICKRIKRGWSISDAITTPVMR